AGDAGRGVALHGHRYVHVVALNERRAGDIADLDQRAERHQLAAGGAHLQLQYVLAVDAELLVGLRLHLVDAAEGVEIVDVGSAEIDRQRLEDLRDLDVQHTRLVAVDRQEELRARCGEGGEDAGQTGGQIGRASCRERGGDRREGGHVKGERRG